jgi:glycosyltransferase involved in cell wall biosynthesis
MAVRNELAIPRDRTVLSIISRIFPWKGHELLLRALHTVARRAEEEPSLGNFVLLLVGEDDARATPGREGSIAHLREVADELGIADHVLFTGFRSDVPAVMAASDVFAMPSFEEPFGIVFLEAMALCKPVVALRNGGTVEVVVDGVTGLLSDPADVDGLADNIVRMIRDPALRRAMGEAGRARVETAFTPALLGANIGDLYTRLLDR